MWSLYTHRNQWKSEITHRNQRFHRNQWTTYTFTNSLATSLEYLCSPTQLYRLALPSWTTEFNISPCPSRKPDIEYVDRERIKNWRCLGSTAASRWLPFQLFSTAVTQRGPIRTTGPGMRCGRAAGREGGGEKMAAAELSRSGGWGERRAVGKPFCSLFLFSRPSFSFFLFIFFFFLFIFFSCCPV